MLVSSQKPGAPETLCIDGGGTKTWLCFTSAPLAAVAGPSTSVDLLRKSSPQDTLVSLVNSCMGKSSVPPESVGRIVVFHAAASTQAKADEYLAIALQVAEILHVSAQVVVTNDMVPLLYAGGDSSTVSLIAGTGTSAGAKSRDGRFGRIGGGDFVLSDQGGGFDVGMSGLRSVVKGLDGRADHTALIDRALRWLTNPIAEGPVTAASFIEAAYDAIYGPAMRTRVASFAKEVCLAAAAEDRIAIDIVSRAASDLVQSIESAADSLLLEEFTVVLSGSLIGEGSTLGASVERLLNLNDRAKRCIRYESSDALRIADSFASDIASPERLDRLRSAFPVCSSDRAVRSKVADEGGGQ